VSRIDPPLLCGLLLWMLLLMVIGFGCDRPGALAPAPEAPIPRFCGQALRQLDHDVTRDEVVVLCADTRPTCEHALWLARKFGRSSGIRRVATSCYFRGWLVTETPEAESEDI
jgi:hypothetical protein